MIVVTYTITYVEGALAGQQRTASDAFSHRAAAERYAQMLRGYASTQRTKRGIVATYRVSDVRVENDGE